jgi:predicted hydrocarbon binding protein
MPEFSARLLRAFAETIADESGRDDLQVILEKAELPSAWADLDALSKLDPAAAGEVYAGLQRALRTYYGRGARGILLRVGAQLWKRLLDGAPFSLRPQIALVRGLPAAASRKPALNLLARLFSTKAGDLTVHNMDLDLLLVDHASPAAAGQHEDEPICWLTIGLVRESLSWAAHREFDVTEISCRALGAPACEFKVKVD